MDNTWLQLNVINGLRTGNPMLDVVISGLALSILTWVASNYQTYWKTISGFFKKLFAGTVKSELNFTGEEYADRWGDVTRNYPESFRAILHFVNSHKCDEVNAYTELRTTNRRYRHDDDKSKKRQSTLYKPTVTLPFHITKDILCEVTYEETNAEDKKTARQQTKRTDLRLHSYTLDVDVLKQFVEKAVEDYDNFIKEQIDQNQYYFITKVEKVEDQTTLMYDQYEFTTNRSFQNIFFEKKAELKRRIDFFLNNKEWYKTRGVPYTLGFMFHGKPGTGKTSTIKALASYTKRHIVEVSLGRIKTYRELQRVFHENNFCEKHIPHDKIIFVIEDIDCLDEIVQSRGEMPSGKKDGPVIADPFSIPPPPPKPVDDDDEETEEDKKLTETMDAKLEKRAKEEYQQFKTYQKMWNKDPLTLSHLLNVLDGLIEHRGRILIITTNQPEKLDQALIRPGRVDMTVEFNNANIEDTVKLVEMFYEKEFPTFERKFLMDGEFSPAEIYNVCFQEPDMTAAIERLKNAVKEGKSMRQTWG